MKKILVVGSAALDTIETPWGKAQDALGGSAIYFTAAAGFFAPVNVVGVVGGDFPRDQLSLFHPERVNLDGLQVIDDGKSFRWHGRYHYDINQRDTLLTELNVFEHFDPDIPEHYRDSEILLLANIDPDLQLKVLDQVRQPELVILDTMNLWIETKPDSLKQVISRADMLIVNDAEVRQLTEQPSLVKGAKMLLEWGPRVIIVKKGEHGAIMVDANGFFVAPAYPLENAFDPTGAGDTFAGGFAGYLAVAADYETSNLRRAIMYGTSVASFTVEDFSLQRLRTLTWDEIKERFEQLKTITRFD